MYRYTTVSKLLLEGINRNLGVSKITTLIETYSRFFNMVTNQIFFPKRIVSKQFYAELNKFITPDSLPIIHVNSFSKILDSDSKQVLTKDVDYFINNEQRFIELNNYAVNDVEDNLLDLFYKKAKRDYYELDAILGWIDKKDEIVTITTSEDLTNTKDSLILNDVSKLRPRDILTFPEFNLLIDTVDYDTNTITFDILSNIKTIRSGTEVKCYGSLLNLVEDGIVRLCLNYRKLNKHVGGRILLETIDQYQVKSTGTLTGIFDVDLIVEKFQPPIIAFSS